MKRTFIVCDDRPSAEVGVRLLVASLDRYARGESIRVVFPPADDEFKAWIAEKPVTLQTSWPSPHGGWDVKPAALLEALDDADEVVWLDSDVICAGDPRPLFDGLDEATLAVGEEPGNGTVAGGCTGRAADWGFAVGRDLPALNSGTLRVTRHHRPLLEAWREAMNDPRYRDNQTRHQRDRDLGCVGDQDVLSALVGSEPFADVPVKLLRSGRDVVQNLGTYGWLPRDRLRAMRAARRRSFTHWAPSRGRLPSPLGPRRRGSRSTTPS